MEEKLVFSFIVPCYNAAETLETAVDSICVEERFRSKYEILLVLNGCTDGTQQIAENLQKKYADVQIRVLESGKGVSKARNKGIREANGQWLVFLDADDTLALDAVKVFLEDLQYAKADFYLYGHRKGVEQVHILNEGADKYVHDHINVQSMQAQIIENPTRYMQVWAKLFNRNLVVENQLFFQEELRLAEDSDFTLRYMLSCCHAMFLHDVPVYQYALSEGSAMRTYDGQKVEQYLISMLESKKAVERANPQIKKAFEIYILMHLNIAMVREIFCVENPAGFRAKVKKMQEIAKQEPFAECIAQVKISECGSARMLPILCLKLKVACFAGIIYMIRAKQNSKKEKRGN